MYDGYSLMVKSSKSTRHLVKLSTLTPNSELKRLIPKLNIKRIETYLEVGRKSVAKISNRKESVKKIFSTEFECAICREIFVDATNLNCGHTFCFVCIENWKLNVPGGRRPTCPYCCTEIRTQTSVRAIDNLID